MNNFIITDTRISTPPPAIDGVQAEEEDGHRSGAVGLETGLCRDFHQTTSALTYMSFTYMQSTRDPHVTSGARHGSGPSPVPPCYVSTLLHSHSCNTVIYG